MIVLHVPHGATLIPSHLRQRIVLGNEQLADELLCMTDWYVDELFALPASEAQAVVYPVSRLVCDPERFESDVEEPMAQRGMGVIYTATHDLGELRPPPTPAEREDLLRCYYRPHHQRLTEAIAQVLQGEGGWRMSNPADAARPPRNVLARLGGPQVWSAEQLGAFLATTRDDRFGSLWHTLAMTGMRRGEALGLRWTDVDLEVGRLSIQRSLVPAAGEVIVSEPKTAKGRRSIALDTGTVDGLREQAQRQLHDQVAAGEAYSATEGYVFTDELGGPLDPDRVSKCFNAAVRAAMLPRIRLHDLRHTHATLALQAGVHPKVVQERLGHSTIAITLDIYSHVIPAMQEEAAALIAGLVFSHS